MRIYKSVMSLYLDTKYLGLLSPHLPLFKQIDSNTYRCRCTVCGDSKKDKTKTRLYFYIRQNKLHVYCHNCGYSGSFRKFLELSDPGLYKQYSFEVLQELKSDREILHAQKEAQLINTLRSSRTITNAEMTQDAILKKATRLDKLDRDHPCVQYVKGRLIPDDKLPLLYYTNDFRSFVNGIIPNKFKGESRYKEPRLIIPYLTKDGKCFAFQGRALNPNATIRYYTIKVNENIPAVYGLDRVNLSKPVYCTEGPIDSLFLPNCLAVSGSSYNDKVIERIKGNLIIVPDNERRNASVTQQLFSMVNNGYKVCLWPEGLDFKDINEAIQKGYTTEQLVDIINKNTVSGLSGVVKFKLWKR